MPSSADCSHLARRLINTEARWKVSSGVVQLFQQFGWTIKAVQTAHVSASPFPLRAEAAVLMNSFVLFRGVSAFDLRRGHIFSPINTRSEGCHSGSRRSR